MHIVMDYETYYNESEGYTLRKMPIEAYVKDSRFTLHLLAVRIDGGPTHCLVGESQIREGIKALPIHRKDVYTYALNGKFDHFITEHYCNKRVENPVCISGLLRWTGVSKLCSENLAAVSKFMGLQDKGAFLTKVMGRQLNDLSKEELESYIEYAKIDVDNEWEIVKRCLPMMTRLALDTIAATTSMYTKPKFTFDAELLEKYLIMLKEKREAARERIMHLFSFSNTEDFIKSLRSAEKFAGMLRELGVEPPVKLSVKKTATAKRKAEEKGEDSKDIEVFTYAFSKTDEDFTSLVNHDNEDVVALVETKLEQTSSIAETRAARFLDISKRGYVSIPLEPFNTITGRFSGGGAREGGVSEKVNFQNLAKRNGDKTLRYALTCDDNNRIVAGDSSQIECRVGAYIAQQINLLELFANKECPYCHMAAKIYSTTYEELFYWTKGEGKHLTDERKTSANWRRGVGKEAVLSCQYSIGVDKFARRARQNKVYFAEDKQKHFEEASRILNIWRDENYAITAFWKTCGRILQHMLSGGKGYFGGPNNNMLYYDGAAQLFGVHCPTVYLPDGYPIRYYKLRQEQNAETGYQEMFYDKWDAKHKQFKVHRIYGAALFANVTQGTAAAILREQAWKINKHFPINLNVHDEYASVVPKEAEQQARKIFEQHLTEEPEWIKGVPLACDIGSGRRYGEV